MQKFHLTKIGIKKICLSLVATLLLGSQFTSAHSAPKTILVLGDSLSAEYGLVRGTGWVALLEQRLKEKKRDVSIINASISGETTSGGLARLPDLLQKYQPTVVIVELGGNDGLRGLPLNATITNFNAIIDASKKNNARVLLVGMRIPPNYGKSYADQFSAMYPALAKQWQIALVPFFMEGLADKPDMFQADRIHLIGAAHPRVLENIWPHLSPLIK